MACVASVDCNGPFSYLLGAALLACSKSHVCIYDLELLGYKTKWFMCIHFSLHISFLQSNLAHKISFF